MTSRRPRSGVDHELFSYVHAFFLLQLICVDAGHLIAKALLK